MVDSDYLVKQVIVMRKDLNMRKGKMVAQGAHASIAWTVPTLLATRTNNPTEIPILRTAEYLWLEGKFTKICVYVKSELALLAVHALAQQSDLHSELIEDAGLTEFDGVPTLTCCAIGPDWNAKIDEVTGGLPLL